MDTNLEIREKFNLVQFCTDVGINLGYVAESFGVCHRAFSSIYGRRCSAHLTAAAYLLVRVYSKDKAAVIDARVQELVGGGYKAGEKLTFEQGEQLLSKLKITWAKASRICLMDKLNRAAKEHSGVAYRYTFILVAAQLEYDTLQSALQEIAERVPKARDVVSVLRTHYAGPRNTAPVEKIKAVDPSKLCDRKELADAGMDYEELDELFADYRPAPKLHGLNSKVGAHEYMIVAMWLADSEATQELLIKARDFVDDSGIWPDPSYVSTMRRRMTGSRQALNEVLMVGTMPYYYSRVGGSHPDDHLFAIACVLRIYFQRELVELLKKSPLTIYGWMKNYEPVDTIAAPPSLRAKQDPMREKTAFVALYLNSWYGKNSHAQQ